MAKKNANHIPNFHWRDGRPRWIPGPTIRARTGMKAQDLKDGTGAWLSKGMAIDAAEKLNAQARGDGPEGAVIVKPRSISALIDAYTASPEMRDAPQGKEGSETAKSKVLDKLRLANRTRQGYRSHLKLIKKMCGNEAAAALTPAHIKELYYIVVEERGLATANACMRVFKLLYNFAIDQLKWREIEGNPLRGVKLAPTDGRRVMFSPEEFNTVVAAADYAGLASIGDAVTLAALTGQRKADVLSLQEGDLQGDIYVLTPAKTARSTAKRAYVPVTRPLRARLMEMRRRKREHGTVVHTMEVISSQTGAPYHPGGKVFDREWWTVRALASGLLFAVEDILFAMAGQPAPERNLPFTPRPDIIGKDFADLRDTAVTWLFIAGCTEAEIANIQGRSLTSVKAVLDKHYLVRNADLSKAAGDKFEAFLGVHNIGG